MNPIVFDMEANGLIRHFNKQFEYHNVSKVWCISTIELGTLHKRHFGPKELDKGLEYIQSAPCIIGHNIINYDLRVFKMLYDFDYYGKVIDTFTLSQYLYPERAGGHRIEAWGNRVGIPKPEHEDWSQYTPEMKVRCDQDTYINYLAYIMLREEQREEIEGVQLWVR